MKDEQFWKIMNALELPEGAYTRYLRDIFSISDGKGDFEEWRVRYEKEQKEKLAMRDKEHPVDHFYWDLKSNCYRSKQSQKKSSTGCPQGMIEREWCKQRDLYRIWDCGKKRWVFDLAKTRS